MVETLLVGGIVTTLLIIIITALFMVRAQRHGLQSIYTQQQAWERAQEFHQYQWQAQQEKRATATDNRLSQQTQQVHNEWQEWKARDTERVERLAIQAEVLALQLEATATQAHITYSLQHLPRTEDVSLLTRQQNTYYSSESHWKPLSMPASDLSERDLSHRYLGCADLRDAHMVRTNLFMADLSKACLAGADLTSSDLCAANLSRADLRGANLSSTNMLATDLHQAILIGTNLLNVTNLTEEQLATAIIDQSTQLDPEIHITLPRIPRARKITSGALTTSSMVVASTEPETPLPLLPTETPLPMRQEAIPMLSASLLPASDDNQQAPEARDRQADIPESIHIAEPGTAPPKLICNDTQ